MSWHFLQEQEVAYWEGTSLDGAPSALLKLMPTAGGCCSLDNGTGACRRSPSGMTCEPSTGDPGEGGSMLSVVGSHAKTLANVDQEQGLTVPEVAFGWIWRGLCLKYDRGMSSWKTHHCLFPEDLPESSVTLPRWGRMSADGELWEPMTVPLRMSARDVGLSGRWPTPRATDGDRGGRGDLIQAVRGNSNKHFRKWPTPRANEGGPDFAKLERGRRTGQSISPSLATAVAIDGGSESGPLNPSFREWLMGWPIEWSAREPLATAKFREWRQQHGGF